MHKGTKGCHAVAEAITLCRPRMICAYPNTSQARILESLGELAKTGKLTNCEFINVESDFAAMSVAIGASAAGARTYTVTSSQGLLFMAAAVYSAAGLGLPIVMTITNCAQDSPSNIWNDHTDSMSMRDAGWIQLYAESNQEALDLHIQAFRLAETLSCPVMVCVEGSMLARADDRVDVPTQAQVDAYLPQLEARQMGDPANPVSVGATIGPEAFMEMRYLAHHKQLRALSLIRQFAGVFLGQFGRSSGGLLRAYRTQDAETIIVALGSVNSAIREAVDDLRGGGARIGSISMCSFRPFPLGVLRDALQNAKRVVVLEKSLAVGLGGILSDGVRKSLSGTALNVFTVVAGLGGRAITRASLKQLFEDAAEDELEQLTFLDLNADLVASQLEREARTHHLVPETL